MVFKKGQIPWNKGKHLSEEFRKKMSELKKGKILSGNYINNRSKFLIKCEKEHIFSTNFHELTSGKWCLRCSGLFPLTIEEMQQIATEREGLCLSEKYINSRTSLEWQCNKGHKWLAHPASIKRGSWCPYCAKKIKLTIEEMRNLAKKKKGVCLSDKYVTNKTKLLWKCADGHQWWQKPEHIKNGHWCPFCNSGTGERVCRMYFEKIFGKEFPKVKPSWLINPFGNKMELDGYCEELKLAFEYQGLQHYIPHKLFSRSRTFKDQITADEMKKYMCHMQGITLIEVPHDVEFEKMGDFIIRSCEEQNLVVPIKTISINYHEAYSPQKIREMQIMAKKRGGKCLSTIYNNSQSKLIFQCSNMHEWETTPSSITEDHWCPKCARKENAKKTSGNLEDVHKLARLRGGVCLSNEYINSKTKLRFRCAKMHEWETGPINVSQGRWCPFCGHSVRLSIDEVHQVLQNKQGRLISGEYLNQRSKMKVQCKEGHVWLTDFHRLKRGDWCAKCYHLKRTRRAV